MVLERQRAGALTGTPHPQQRPDDLAVAAMHAVEEPDRQREAALAFGALEGVMDPQSSTLRGASSAPSASPMPTSERLLSRTKTCRSVAPMGSGTILPARKSAALRPSSTIVGKASTRSGGTSARSGSASISSIDRLS